MQPEFQLVGEMGLMIRREVAAGFRSDEQIVRSVVEMHAGEATEKELRALAEELAGSIFFRQMRKQRDWPLVTDCDRLDLAFAALTEKGIVIRHDLDDEGAEKFIDEVDRTAEGRHPARGYVFYQRQATEAAIDGHGLYLDYGAAEGADDDEEDEADLRIGHEVVEALHKQGLETLWNEDPSARINVKLDWKRRRWSDED